MRIVPESTIVQDPAPDADGTEVLYQYSGEDRMNVVVPPVFHDHPPLPTASSSPIQYSLAIFVNAQFDKTSAASVSL